MKIFRIKRLVGICVIVCCSLAMTIHTITSFRHFENREPIVAGQGEQFRHAGENEQKDHDPEKQPRHAGALERNVTGLEEPVSTSMTPADHHVNKPNLMMANTGKPSVIMLWTTFFKSPTWLLKELGKSPFQKCLYNNCDVVNDKDKYMESAHMFLFSCVDQVILPKVRYPWQIYAAYCWESPAYYRMPALKNLAANMTITYRPDSDVTDWAKKIKRRDTQIPGPYELQNPFSLKHKNVVWGVSNCNTPSKRNLYVNELSKYIDVDIYGKCGKLECPRKGTGRDCYSKFEKQYKFYLSFENSICTGYVTEKFFYPLDFELVPIVLGGANYSQFAPPHSYINVADFESPRRLADYLKFLSGNETEYKKYFQWKQNFEVGDGELWCDVCKAAMQRSSFHRELSPTELLSWWNDGTCDNGLVERLLSPGRHK